MTDSSAFDPRRAALGLVLFLLTAVYLICNLGHIQLAVAISSDDADVAQVYYSHDGSWNEPQSTAAALAAGRNDVRLGLPGLLTGGFVRFDPGRRAATYRISSIRWIGTGYELPLALDSLVNARTDASEVALSANELVVVARDNDPQLLVPTPPFGARVQAAAWPLGVSLIALVLVVFALRRRIGLPALAAALLGTCALLYFFACLTVGPRLPLADDWRYVMPGPFNLIDGSWQWLGVVGNDTYFLTNQILDFLVLKFSNADFLWLRGVTVALLLLQLAMQYRVVSRAALASPAVAAVAIMLGLWSLAAGAYWSGTTIAYQQALPTIFGSAMLVLLVAPDGSIRSRLSLGLLIACCIGSGLSYISGGLLILSLGVAYLLAVDWRRAPSSAVRIGAVLLGFGVALLVLQFALVSHQQGSLLEHNHHSESVFPTDRRFWLFFFALFGRALGYGGVWVPADILYTLLALLPAVIIGMQRLRALFRADAPATQPTWTLLALYAGIGSASYAAIVAFGRAGFAPADSAASVITAMGKGRFHFWPVAAMLPYAWLGWMALLQRVRLGATAASVIVGTLMLAPKSLLLLDNVATLRDIDRSAHDGARCVVAHLADAEAGRPVVCRALTSAPNDIGPTLMHLHAIKSRLYDEVIAEGTAVSP